ncbi:glycine zipper 2TM domain-containing protein [Lysobacter sp. TY2-98]|nr:glycine zipper 2TM domain-containing protein [Lysobacter sp. TY2-98]
MLLGGVAVAAYSSINHRDEAVAVPAAQPAIGATQFDASADAQGRIAPTNPELAAPRAEYADVVDVDPVRTSSPRYAQVIGVDPVKETSTTSTPRQVCNDVVVQERLPERDGNVGGTVAGALIGGLVGNQVGAGNGKKLATVAGAVGGGFIGNRVDRNHVGGRVVDRTEQQCHTVSDRSSSSRTVAYNVTFRNPDGTTGTQRMASRPGSRIKIGTDTNVAGYDVTYRYQGTEHTVRMNERPGSQLPVIDGRVVTSTAVASRG